MTNFSIDDFIKDISPELQEKARACKSREEVLELAAEEDIELSDEALEAVSGGCNTPKGKPYCRSDGGLCILRIQGVYQREVYICPICKAEFNCKEVDWR